jgi:histidine triad (HIT) family protein
MRKTASYILFFDYNDNKLNYYQRGFSEIIRWPRGKGGNCPAALTLATITAERRVMRDCIFCRIAAGEAPAARVLETPGVLAFLDIAPVNYGHTLVIPKSHYENLLDLPDDLWLEIGQVCRQVAQALRATLKAQGFNIGMNNFAAAGQEVFHAHLHVIPRYDTDGLRLFPQETYKPGEMENTGEQLRRSLGRTEG